MTSPNVENNIRQTVEAVVQRDHKRIRRLAGATIALWLLTAAVIPAFYLPMRALVMPKFQQLEKHALEKDERINVHLVAWHVAEIGKAMIFFTTAFMIIFTMASLVAATFTVMLVYATRRATLRQINENLAEISNQLRALQPGP